MRFPLVSAVFDFFHFVVTIPVFIRFITFSLQVCLHQTVRKRIRNIDFALVPLPSLSSKHIGTMGLCEQELESSSAFVVWYCTPSVQEHSSSQQSKKNPLISSFFSLLPVPTSILSCSSTKRKLSLPVRV